MRDYRSAEVRVVDESGDTHICRLPGGSGTLDIMRTSEGMQEWRFTFRFLPPASCLDFPVTGEV